MDSGLIKLNDIVILLNKEDYIGGAFFPRIFRRAGDIVQKMPWIKYERNLKNYLKLLFVEVYIYEKYAQRHALNNPYVWNGDVFNVNDNSNIKYLDSGIHSDKYDEDIFIRLTPKNISNSSNADSELVTSYYLLEFVPKPDEISSPDCICCFNIFDRLPIKRLINIKRLFGEQGQDIKPNKQDIKPNKIINHILKREDDKFTDRIKRLPIDYQRLIDNNEIELRQKLEDDINYSLDVIRECPYLAVPITINDNNTNERDYIKYVGQFAIPLYRKDNKSVYAALPLSCKDAVPEINEYKKLHDKIERYRDALSSLDVDVYLSYCYCSYTCKTILTFDMVRDDCLFTLHGNNISPSLWFNNRKLHGVVVMDSNNKLCIHADDYYYELGQQFNLEKGEHVCFNAIPKYYNRATGKLKWIVSSIYSIETASSNNTDSEGQNLTESAT